MQSNHSALDLPPPTPLSVHSEGGLDEDSGLCSPAGVLHALLLRLHGLVEVPAVLSPILLDVISQTRLEIIELLDDEASDFCLVLADEAQDGATLLQDILGLVLRVEDAVCDNDNF